MHRYSAVKDPPAWPAPVAELVDAFDSKSNFLGSAGSSPARGTRRNTRLQLIVPDAYTCRCNRGCMMENPLEVGGDRYQAEYDYVYASDPVLRFDQKRLASMVGYVAIGLPIILGLGGMAFGDFRQSMSGFYYERVLLGDIFVGSLVFIGTLMFAYRGWARKVASLATIAGLASYLVALFPAAGWLVGKDNEPIFVKATNIIHAGGALVLFLILAFFCFFVFTKVEPHQIREGGVPEDTKRIRNRIYRISGTLILLAIVAIGLGNYFCADWAARHRVTYWAEAVMLIAFGISWLVHGRALGTLLLDERDKHDIAIAEAREETAEED